MREEIKAAISKRLLVTLGAKMRTDVVFGWTQVKAAVQGAEDEDKAQIIKLLLSTDLLKSHLDSLAGAEADDMLENDSLDLTELAKILN